MTNPIFAGFHLMKSNIIFLTLFFLAGLSNLSAQDPPEEHKVRFRTLGWQVAADDLLYELKHHDSSISVTEAARSIFFEAPKEKQIVFYRLVPGPDDKEVREIAATVDISKAGPMPLLLFMADPAAPNHYLVTASADDPKAFPFPSARFINLTAEDLNGSYGVQKFNLPRKGIVQLDPRLNPNGGPQGLLATVSRDTPQGPQLLYNTNWVVRPNYRTLVFIFPQDKRTSVMRITDDNSMLQVRPNK